MTQKEFHNSRTFSSPSPVVHPEVSVQWTRDGWGDVLISLKVPRDIVDVELFVKMTRGHFGILMDPWSSSSWRKYWSQWHTSNKITKEKIWHLKQVKAERWISLYRMAGQGLMKQSAWKTTPHQYNPRAEGLLEQNNPWPKGAGKMQRKLNKVRFESRPRKRQRPMPRWKRWPHNSCLFRWRQRSWPHNNSCWFGRRQTEGPGGRTHKRRRTPSVSPQKKRKEICHMHTPQGRPPYPHLKMMTGKPKVSPDWSLQMRTKTPW